MLRSTDRILVSHAGTLPRPDDLAKLMEAGPEASEAFEQRLPSAVREVVRQQVDLGIDIVNDGELGKRGGFSGYLRDRIRGVEQRTFLPGEEPTPRDVTGRDKRDFPKAFASGIGWFRQRARSSVANQPFFCIAPAGI